MIHAYILSGTAEFLAVFAGMAVAVGVVYHFATKLKGETCPSLSHSATIGPRATF